MFCFRLHLLFCFCWFATIVFLFWWLFIVFFILFVQFWCCFVISYKVCVWLSGYILISVHSFFRLFLIVLLLLLWYWFYLNAFYFICLVCLSWILFNLYIYIYKALLFSFLALVSCIFFILKYWFVFWGRVLGLLSGWIWICLFSVLSIFRLSLTVWWTLWRMCWTSSLSTCCSCSSLLWWLCSSSKAVSSTVPMNPRSLSVTAGDTKTHKHTDEQTYWRVILKAFCC